MTKITIHFRDGSRMDLIHDGEDHEVAYEGSFIVVRNGNHTSAFPFDLIYRLDAVEVPDEA